MPFSRYFLRRRDVLLFLAGAACALVSLHSLNGHINYGRSGSDSTKVGKIEMSSDGRFPGHVAGVTHAIVEGTGLEKEGGDVQNSVDPFWVVVTLVDGIGNQMFQYGAIRDVPSLSLHSKLPLSH